MLTLASKFTPGGGSGVTGHLGGWRLIRAFV